MAYCTNCGKQVEDSDRFCAACGTPRRVEADSEGTRVAVGPAVGLPSTRPQPEAPAWTQAATPTSTPSYADWSEPARPSTATTGGEGFERLSTRAGWTVAALIISMLVSGFGIIAYLNEMTLVAALDAGRRVSIDELETSDSLVASAGGLAFIALLFTATTFLMWLHLAWVNVERRGLQGVRWSASWAVGWWFIPIMNIFRPYQVMSALWRASQTPSDAPGSTEWAIRGSSPMLGWWWALYLAAGVVGGLFSAVRGDSSIDFETWLGADLLIMAGLALQIASGVLAIMLVRRITSMHERLRVGG